MWLSAEDDHFINSKKIRSTSGGMEVSPPKLEIPPLDPKEAMFALTCYAQLLTKMPQKYDEIKQ